MRFKHYLFFLLALVFLGCEKHSINDLENENEFSNKEIDIAHVVKQVSFSSIKSKPVFEILLEKNNLEKVFFIKKNMSKNQEIDVEEIEIDTNFVTKIEYDKKDYLSYTFKVKDRKNSHGLIENLLIEHDNGKNRAFLISYKPDSDWAINYLKGNKMAFKGKIAIRVLDGDSKTFSQDKSGCTYVTATTYTQCTCVGHWPGEYCTCANKPNVSVTTIPICGGMTEVYSDGASSGGGGGGGSGTGGELPTTGLTGVGGDDSAINTAQALISMLNLNSIESEWITNNNVSQGIDMSDLLYSYIKWDQFSDRSLIAVKKALIALIDDPYLPWDLVENWYLNLQDIVDTDFQNSPSQLHYSEPLTQQPLPSLANFISNFPKVGSAGNYSTQSAYSVYYELGGSLWVSFQASPKVYGNACSIRGSKGLTYSGIKIPIIWLDSAHKNQRTQKGGDNKNYILDAITFNKFMIDKFGDTPDKLLGSDANDPVKVGNFLRRKKGIYVIVNNDPKTAGYNGHADAIINGKCISNAYTTPKGGVKSIRVWKLQ